MIKYFNLNYPGLELIGDHIVRKEVTYTTRAAFVFMKTLIRHFILHPDPMVVPVHHFEVIEDHPDNKNLYGRFVYAYEMMRLGMLENEEKRIIEEAAGHRWQGYITKDQMDINPHFINARKNYPKLLPFMNKVISLGRYHDIHSGNFLKDNDGDYRIIDLEGFGNPPIDDPTNSWITR